MKNKLILTLLTIVILFSALSCTNPKIDDSPLLNNINSIEINPHSESKIVYEKDNNPEEIMEFITAYNEANPTDDSLGTTHSNTIIINYSNGERVIVLGGTQNFQTVISGEKQFNIQGDKLWDYFKRLHKQFYW